MNQIIAIGDIHGRDCWKELLTHDIEKEYERIIFIGDYFDSYDLSVDKQIDNFLEIRAFKEKYPEIVILLFGNHDYHYIGDFSSVYSGFNAVRAFEIRSLLKATLSSKLFDIAHVEEINDQYYLFTHAGVTKTWWNNHIDQLEKFNILTCKEKLNDLFYFKPISFEFDGVYSFTGNERRQTPIWVRPESLMKDPIDQNIIQVVGHTHHREITMINNFIFIDVLDNDKFEYLNLNFKL